MKQVVCNLHNAQIIDEETGDVQNVHEWKEDDVLILSRPGAIVALKRVFFEFPGRRKKCFFHYFQMNSGCFEYLEKQENIDCFQTGVFYLDTDKPPVFEGEFMKKVDHEDQEKTLTILEEKVWEIKQNFINHFITIKL